MPFECYKTYLAMKQHFTKDKYDYVKYCGRSRASLQSFYKRKDRYFFEKMARQHPDKETNISIWETDLFEHNALRSNGEKVLDSLFSKVI